MELCGTHLGSNRPHQQVHGCEFVLNSILRYQYCTDQYRDNRRYIVQPTEASLKGSRALSSDLVSDEAVAVGALLASGSGAVVEVVLLTHVASSAHEAWAALTTPVVLALCRPRALGVTVAGWGERTFSNRSFTRKVQNIVIPHNNLSLLGLNLYRHVHHYLIMYDNLIDIYTILHSILTGY